MNMKRIISCLLSNIKKVFLAYTKLSGMKSNGMFLWGRKKEKRSQRNKTKRFNIMSEIILLKWERKKVL